MRGSASSGISAKSSAGLRAGGATVGAAAGAAGASTAGVSSGSSAGSSAATSASITASSTAASAFFSGSAFSAPASSSADLVSATPASFFLRLFLGFSAAVVPSAGRFSFFSFFSFFGFCSFFSFLVVMRAPKASIFLSITSLLFSWLVVAPAAGEVRGNISAEASPFPWSCVGLGEAGCSSLAASLSLSSAPEGSSFFGILKATFSAPPPPPVRESLNFCAFSSSRARRSALRISASSALVGFLGLTSFGGFGGLTSFLGGGSIRFLSKPRIRRLSVSRPGMRRGPSSAKRFASSSISRRSLSLSSCVSLSLSSLRAFFAASWTTAAALIRAECSASAFLSSSSSAAPTALLANQRVLSLRMHSNCASRSPWDHGEKP